jgi:hypothetical protein
MGKTAAAEIARLKVRYVNWTIRAVVQGEGWTAQRRAPGPAGKPTRIHALTAAELGAKLAEAEDRPGVPANP